MIAEALAEFAVGAARTFEGRTETVGGSDVGRCARAVYFTKNENDPIFGAPRDPDAVDSWGAQLRGSTFECPPSALVRQIQRVEEGRISGSS